MYNSEFFVTDILRLVCTTYLNVKMSHDSANEDSWLYGGDSNPEPLDPTKDDEIDNFVADPDVPPGTEQSDAIVCEKQINLVLLTHIIHLFM